MSEFTAIHDPETGERFSIFSSQGRNLLKMYLLTYKSGGTNNTPFTLNNNNKQNDDKKKYDELKTKYDKAIVEKAALITRNKICENNLKQAKKNLNLPSIPILNRSLK